MKIEKKEVFPVKPVYEYNFTLTEREALTLCVICGNIAGDYESEIRKLSSAVYATLNGDFSREDDFEPNDDYRSLLRTIESAMVVK